MIFVKWMVLLFIGLLYAQNSTVLFYQCINNIPLLGNLCFKADHVSCYELIGEIKIGNRDIYKGNFSIPEIIIDYYNIESKTSNYCVDLGMTMLVTRDSICRVCYNADHLEINKTINMSGNVTVDCNTTFGHLNRTFNLSRISIDNCLVFGCPNDCSKHGTCNDKGFCNCSPSYFGPDCSIELTDSYVYAPFLPSKLYWDLKVETCDIVSLQVKDSDNKNILDVKEKLSNLNEISLYPCQVAFEENCELCIKMYNLSILNKDELHGCLEAKYQCLGRDLYNYKMGCRRLLISEKLNNCTLPTTTSFTTKISSTTSSTREITSTKETTLAETDTKYTYTASNTPTTSDNESKNEGELTILSITMIIILIVVILGTIVVVIIVRYKRNNVDNEYKFVMKSMKRKNQVV